MIVIGGYHDGWNVYVPAPHEHGKEVRLERPQIPILPLGPQTPQEVVLDRYILRDWYDTEEDNPQWLLIHVDMSFGQAIEHLIKMHERPSQSLSCDEAAKQLIIRLDGLSWDMRFDERVNLVAQPYYLLERIREDLALRAELEHVFGLRPEKVVSISSGLWRHLIKLMGPPAQPQTSGSVQELQGSADPIDLTAAGDAIGRWLSAALEDPTVCAEMKADINAWFLAVQEAARAGTFCVFKEEGR